MYSRQRLSHRFEFRLCSVLGGKGGAVQNEYRLTPDMTSRKLQVVSFVKQYISRWGQWPSYGEIGGAMGISPSTARDAVKRAVRDNLLHREPGSRRGVVKTAETRSRLCPTEAAEMLERLREAGVIVMDTAASSATPTFYPLPISPPFRHLPDIE
jgi:Mn-dependent DtxR family transcriptional regulator